MEEIVFLAAGALCALNAAHEQQRHPDGYEDCQQIGICRKPMNQFVHTILPTGVDATTPVKIAAQGTLGRSSCAQIFLAQDRQHRAEL